MRRSRLSRPICHDEHLGWLVDQRGIDHHVDRVCAAVYHSAGRRASLVATPESETANCAPMKRTAAAIGVTIAGLALALFVFGRQTSAPPSSPNALPKDSVWYHTSSPALLARTGRPQLVEFFHPG